MTLEPIPFFFCRRKTVQLNPLIPNANHLFLFLGDENRNYKSVRYYQY